jgi:hypothetical protein
MRIYISAMTVVDYEWLCLDYVDTLLASIFSHGVILGS